LLAGEDQRGTQLGVRALQIGHVGSIGRRYRGF
jgi:hypothetical protein